MGTCGGAVGLSYGDLTAVGLEREHNPCDMARTLLVGESNFLLQCDFKELGSTGHQWRSEVRIGQRVVAAVSMADYLCGCCGVGRTRNTPGLQGVEPADVIRPRARPIEGFNDLHAAAAARARGWFVVGGAWVVVIIVVAIHRRRGHTE